MISRKDKNIQFAEYAGNFINQINEADKLRSQSLQRLQKIRSNRQKSQQRQLKRLAAKLGEKHPRVLRQAERIVNEKEMENYLSVVISKADVETESIKDSFILQGRVLGDDITGLAGLQVQLLDARNKVIGKPVKTDRKGFYTIVIDIDASFRLKKVQVVVLDKQGTQIHKEKLPVLVKADSIESRDIMIARINKYHRDKKVILKEVLKTKKAVRQKKASVKKKPSTKVADDPKTRK